MSFWKTDPLDSCPTSSGADSCIVEWFLDVRELQRFQFIRLHSIHEIEGVKMLQANSSAFVFKTNDSIGSAGAEQDRDYLNDCFVDTGDIEILEDTQDHRHIVVGRTGAGKSALLSQMSVRHPGSIIDISPENMALAYVSNSTIINFFSDLGVNLDPFFKLLWRHSIVVDILKKYAQDKKMMEAGAGFWDFFKRKYNGKTREDEAAKAAIKYLEEWSGRFWEESDCKIREITKKG
ncbi:MAG: hypothetical protein IPN71_14915 [Fibrobacteres bacterium]|nr:hypothetical protein [Fibrobacterota bacterium]